MAERLVQRLGQIATWRPELRDFPMARAIAVSGAEFLRREIRLGYRAEYVWSLADAVERGDLDLDSLREPGEQSAYDRVRRLRGFGPYSAAHLAMMVGEYDRLAVDSWARTLVSKHFYGGQPVSERQIADHFAGYGRWQYLAYWFMTWDPAFVEIERAAADEA